MFGKRGLSDVVSVVLIIMLVVAAVAGIWFFIAPLIKNHQISQAVCLANKINVDSCQKVNLDGQTAYTMIYTAALDGTNAQSVEGASINLFNNESEVGVFGIEGTVLDGQKLNVILNTTKDANTGSMKFDVLSKEGLKVTCSADAFKCTTPAKVQRISSSNPGIVDKVAQPNDTLKVILADISLSPVNRENREVGDKFDFIINNEEHSISVTKISGDTSNFTISSSNPTSVSLSLRQPSGIDITGDGRKDVYVKVKVVGGGKVSYEIGKYVAPTSSGLSRYWKFDEQINEGQDWSQGYYTGKSCNDGNGLNNCEIKGSDGYDGAYISNFVRDDADGYITAEMFDGSTGNYPKYKFAADQDPMNIMSGTGDCPWAKECGFCDGRGDDNVDSSDEYACEDYSPSQIIGYYINLKSEVNSDSDPNPKLLKSGSSLFGIDSGSSLFGKSLSLTGKVGSSSDFYYSNLNLGSIRSNTISIWFKTTGSNGALFIVEGPSSSGPYENIGLENGKVKVNLKTPVIINGLVSSVESSLNSSVTYNDGKWHNLIYVNSVSNHKLYVDGVLQESGAVDWQVQYNFERGILGHRAGETTISANIDEVRQYRIPLSEEEVKAIYNSGM